MKKKTDEIFEIRKCSVDYQKFQNTLETVIRLINANKRISVIIHRHYQHQFRLHKCVDWITYR